MEKDIIGLHKIWIATEISDRCGIVKFCSDDIEVSPTAGHHIKGKVRNGDHFGFYEDERVQIACVADGVGRNACDWKASEQV